MVRYFHFCVLILLFSLTFVSGCTDGECRELAFPAYFFFADKRLVKHNITIAKVQDMDACELLCYQEPNCVSINLENKANSEGTFTCELNNATHRGQDGELVNTKDYFYRGAESACDSAQCNNGGKCQSGFTDKRYRCLCLPGFNGENCEKAVDICTTQQPCLNEGECFKDGNGQYTCKCKMGFSGTNCEHKFSINSTILLKNESYSDHLRQFLAHVAGNGSRWLLCYRASLHFRDIGAFHSLCDGKRNTVTIINKDEYVFGGFTDIPWDTSQTFGVTSNAFIFSIRNNEGLAPFKSMVTVPSRAIYRFSSYGPTFGGGHDIVVADINHLSYTRFGHSYSVPDGVKYPHTILVGTVNFSPDEVEVFYLEQSET